MLPNLSDFSAYIHANNGKTNHFHLSLLTNKADLSAKILVSLRYLTAAALTTHMANQPALPLSDWRAG